MNHKASRITNICQMREYFQTVDEFLAPLKPAFNSEREYGASPFRRVFLSHLKIRARGQGSVLHPRHCRVLLQKLGHSQGICQMAIHAQAERFHALQEQERVERADAWPHIA